MQISSLFSRVAALRRLGFAACLLLAGLLAIRATQTAGLAATNTPAAIPWNQIGAKAGADYQGDGLAVTPTGSGARLHCVFQRLDGEATPQGLWLTSTVTNTVSDPSSVAVLRRVDRFRVTAAQVGRVTPCAPGYRAEPSTLNPQLSSLPRTGTVSLDGQTVRFSRPGLTEEYSVSMDGVRQDFIIEQPPLNSQPSTLNQRPGELVVTLAVSGARVEPTTYGAQLVLDKSGRKLAYSRLRATDANGKDLPARIEVQKSSAFALALVVNDAEAVYPVRIDPTFSDANWVSMGGFPGANGPVLAAVMDGSGNLYIGGQFTIAGNAIAKNLAEWNGSSWSALGSGVAGGDQYGPSVYALAVSGGTLYVGGDFTTAGGNAATNIAQWNGSSWSALGSGIAGGDSNGPYVSGLAVSGSTLYAGGDFTTAGGNAATNIAQWNGSSWSALGSGIAGGDQYGPYVFVLAVSGSTLYVGGDFTTAGGNAATNIAQWNGGSWSALGSGLTVYGGGTVYALAVSGGTLYAGGFFATAGGNAANDIAQWDGSGWSPLGSGVNGEVWTLAVSGGTLYAGGYFTTAGGNTANRIAQWNGSSWLALGSGMSGMNGDVNALAVSGGTLYAGGQFTTAGGIVATNIAQWNGSGWSALGSGIGGGNGGYAPVTALAVSGGTLYAAGDFTTAGGTAANYIAQWNGSSWSGLGSGMNNSVIALAVSGSTLYAGGIFTTADGTAANYIAEWNGSSWSQLGSGMNNGVSALAVSGGTLYAGGGFTTAGGTNANYIAQWNGSSWSALGAGMNNSVTALAVSGSMLYAGGNFTTAGTNVSAYAALANLPVPPPVFQSLTITNDARILIWSTEAGSTYQLQYKNQNIPDLTSPIWYNLGTPVIATGATFTFTDSLPTSDTRRVYRVKLLP